MAIFLSTHHSKKQEYYQGVAIGLLLLLYRKALLTRLIGVAYEKNGAFRTS